MNFNFLGLNIPGLGGQKETQSRVGVNASQQWLARVPVVDGTDMYFGDGVPAAVYGRLGSQRVARDLLGGVFKQPNQNRSIVVCGRKVL